jgi:Domain of unknown function (DUF4157)/DNA/RNA non-specific endonuclease
MSNFAGKQTRAQELHVQAIQRQPSPGKGTLIQPAQSMDVQLRENADATGGGAEAVKAAASRGIATSSTTLPHAEVIQRSFGHHDISAVQAHVGPEATASADAMGADAYATGNHVVLGRGRDLFTEAHEAAHFVQQMAGVHLAGGVGEVGDRYERHADEVASLVVQGKSAESLLDQYAGGGRQEAQVQRKVGINDIPNTGYAAQQGPGDAVSSIQGAVPDIDWGALYNGCGTSMDAEIGPNDDLGGSSPSVRPYWWGTLMNSSPATANYLSTKMVQGHLLNDNLGGPGNDMRNLTPITKSANGQHHNSIEKRAKELVKKYNRKIHYTVTADYTRVPPAAWFGNMIPSQFLHLFPYSLHCELEYQNGSSWVPDTAVEITNGQVGQG